MLLEWIDKCQSWWGVNDKEWQPTREESGGALLTRVLFLLRHGRQVEYLMTTGKIEDSISLKKCFTVQEIKQSYTTVKYIY